MSLKISIIQYRVRLREMPSTYVAKYTYYFSIELPRVTIISTTMPIKTSHAHSTLHTLSMVGLGSYVNSDRNLRLSSVWHTRQRTYVLIAWRCLTKAFVKQCSWQKR